MAVGDLCTLADVRARMQKKAGDTAQDALISAFITPASVAVMRWADREFAPATSNLARVFEWPREGELLSLAPYDVRVVTSVTADTDNGAGYALASDEWRLGPKPARDGVFNFIRLRPFGVAVSRRRWAKREVTIVGDWGFPSVPSDVAHATAATVVHWMTTNVAVFRSPEDGPSEAKPRGLPMEACHILGSYKRPVVM